LPVLVNTPPDNHSYLDTGKARIVWAISHPYQAVRTVDIERTASGAIVVAWRAEPESNRHVDMGDILCSVSRDDGKTWSTPVCIAGSDTQWAYANIVLYSHDRTLHAFVGRCPVASPHSEQQVIVSRVSRDDGATWTDGRLDMHYAHPTIGGGKVVRFGSRFLMPFHRNDHGFANKADQNVSHGQYPLLYQEKPIRLHGVLVSDDLRIWRPGGIVPQPAGTPAADAFLQEGFIAPANDGSGDLLLVMREGDWRVTRNSRTGQPDQWKLVSATGCAFVSRSRDGLAWTPAVPWPDIPNHNTKGAFLTDAQGRHIVFYNDAPDRERLFVMARAPGNGTWSVPLMLTGGKGWNCYAMAVEAGRDEKGETRILTAWESGKQHVVFREIYIIGQDAPDPFRE
jgi:hypothetical protein